jgi:putative SOS response-associated peptidase YedK
MNVSDDPLTKALSEVLGASSSKVRKSRDIAPGSTLSIIREQNGERIVSDAIWWLFLDSETLKPNYRYASFNSRSDKLNSAGSLAFVPYREGRCIIPASGFVEGLGDKKTYFHLQPKESAIAFGGLCKEWQNPETGELVYSASIITLPPHQKLHSIHPKSLPLMLPWRDQNIIDLWLDPTFKHVDAFGDLLKPKIYEDVVVTPIDRPSKRNPLGDAFVIESDAA